MLNSWSVIPIYSLAVAGVAGEPVGTVATFKGAASGKMATSLFGNAQTSIAWFSLEDIRKAPNAPISWLRQRHKLANVEAGWRSVLLPSPWHTPFR